MERLPRRLSGKESTYHRRRHRRCEFSPWVGKIPWRRKWQPTPVILPGKFHGQRTLVGYSPWGRKEPDTTGTKHNYIFIITRIWKQPNVLQLLNWINCGTSLWGILLSNWKEGSLDMQGYDGLQCIMLNEESQTQKLHIIWFHLQDVLEKAKLQQQRKDQRIFRN